MPRIATFPLVLALAALLLASCANTEPEVDFKPIQLNWHALSEAAENHPEKDACVISVTSLLMREKAVRESKFESLDYDVMFDIKGERSHALWGEAGIGLKVRLIDRLSMGWMIRYHGVFNYGKSEHSRPWFIPGYGPRTGSLGFSLTINYTLPLHRDKHEVAAPQSEAKP